MSPFVYFDFEKTNLKALKNTQYSIAKIIKIEIQKTVSKSIKRTKNNIVIPIHSKTDIISPPIPSPTSILGKSGKVPELDIISLVLKFLKFGKLSASPIPL